MSSPSSSSTCPPPLSWATVAPDAPGWHRQIKTYYSAKEGERTAADVEQDYQLKQFKYQIIEKVAIIVWDNAKSYNALDFLTNWEILFLLEHFERCDDVHVVFWIASTQKAWCSGANPASFGKAAPVNPELMLGYKNVRKGLCEDFPDGQDFAAIDFALKGIVLRFHSFSKISVAAPTGVAVGGGANMALVLHDFVFVDKNSRFRYPFTDLGVTAEVSSSFVLPKIAGEIAAKDLLMSGRWFDGPECVRLNLATKLVEGDDNELPATAFAFARKLAASSQVSLRKNKKLIHQQTEKGVLAAMNAEQAAFMECLGDPETQALWNELKKKVSGKKQRSKL
mmetsp:Transcript_19004/g.47560  ORF Transcript_19004/g.47560 Transcript_19004/m.47560 type:complete len:338 (-) Transcript_19004:177-1190(-)|eukprot:CAMPEP_0179000336 /NCGR_PEP_ID=MMETSP0795-20121207/10609_1 /TAXON_ID=88552 /ORGANISM="Amoebophrya sp., Strain Ameob2" /LENGTH=337 /DNA_ID=CAMNT_0020693309 /DNA_START=62 /DNA_END=1075 /DNA_ORIENTATION=+